MKVNQATYPVRVMCRLLQVSASGYYAWDERPLCERALVDRTLTGKIDAIHRRSRGAYGAPNIHAELADDHGIRVGRKRVARLMRAANLQGIRLRRFVVTTRRDPAAKPVTDLVERRFYAEAPNRLWVADITYIPTWAGFLYLAAVLDVFSRKAVGWAMATHLRTELVLAALNMAITQRHARGVIHHADHGCTPAPRSGNAAWKLGSCPRWARWVIATTMRWPRASGPRRNGKCSVSTAFARRPKPDWPCSNGWKGGTTRIADIHRWGIGHQRTMNVVR